MRAFGPFIPQDIEKLVKEFSDKHITFEIVSDEQLRKKEISNSPENMLALAEFRTGSALGQIFYVKIAEEHFLENPALESRIWEITTKEKFHPSTSSQEIKSNLEETFRESHELRQELESARSRQRWAARIVIIFILLFILYTNIKSLLQ